VRGAGSNPRLNRRMDWFVAPLLAMTVAGGKSATGGRAYKGACPFRAAMT
jgi:hypothetical protein